MQTSLRTLAPPTARLSSPVRMLLGTLLVAVAAGLAQTAIAQPAGPQAGMHAGMGSQGMGGMQHMDRMLDAVNATADQRAQVKQIMQAAHADLQTQRIAGRMLHEQSQALFAQPTVDARAAEVLRQQMSAQHDVASKRMLQAMLDASRVLTPEQRKTLAERMGQRRALMEKQRAERAALDKATQ